MQGVEVKNNMLQFMKILVTSGSRTIKLFTAVIDRFS